jgi:hypothetical protein
LPGCGGSAHRGQGWAFTFNGLGGYKIGGWFVMDWVQAFAYKEAMTKTMLKVGSVVRYSNPQDGEENFRFTVVGVNENTEAVHIRLNDPSLRIEPIETVHFSDVVEA